MWKKLVKSSLVIMSIVASITVSTQAAFTGSATVSGINFSTGNAALKIFGNPGYTNAGNNGNLTEIFPGPHFDDIGPNWSKDFSLKYFNTGSVNLDTSLRLVSLSDNADLRDNITVDAWIWNDLNHNGVADPTDTFSLLEQGQTLEFLRTHPVEIGQLNSGVERGLLLRFKTADLPSNTQHQLATFDIVIDGTTATATQ